MKRTKRVLNVLLVFMLFISSSMTAFAADKANYRVVFYDENGTQLQEDIREGTVGETVSVEVDDFYALDNYEFDPSNANCVMDTVVKEDGTAQLSIYFKAKSDEGKVTYTVKWFCGEKLLKSEERKAEAGTNVSIIGMDTDLIEVDSNNYTFDPGNAGNVFSTEVKEDGTSELKLYFTSYNAENTTLDDASNADPTKKKGIYTVRWLTNGGKEIKKDIREDLVGELVSIDPDDIAEFDDYVFDMDNDAQMTRAVLEPDGATELRIYFNDNNASRAAANRTTNDNSGSANAAIKETTATTSGTPVFTPVVQTRSSENVQASNTASAQNGVQTRTSAPRTGDETPLMAMVTALVVSAGVIVIVIKNRRNKHYSMR